MADSKHTVNKENRRTMSARTVAAIVLNRFELQKSGIESLLDVFIEETKQKQRATDLVYGTIRNRTALDSVITRLADCLVKRISAKVLNIIRIGVYELIYCPQTPVYSVISEAVENTKKIAGKKQTAFVNAVLRKIASHIKSRQIPLTEQIEKRTLPQNISTGCQFDMDILPDSQKQNADYLSCAFSLPKWLICDWLEQFGYEQTKQICFASNRRPSVYLRPNILRTTVTGLGRETRTGRRRCSDYR